MKIDVANNNRQRQPGYSQYHWNRGTHLSFSFHFQHRRIRYRTRALLVLNVIDAVMTVLWVADRKASESNPLMFDLPEQHPVLFVLVKTSLVSGGTFLLWRHRDRPLAVVAIFVSFLAYYFLLAWHLEALWLAIQHFAGGS